MRRFNGEEKGYIYSRWGNPTMTEAKKKFQHWKVLELKMRMTSQYN